MFALEARRKGRRLLFPLSTFADFRAIPFPEKKNNALSQVRFLFLFPGPLFFSPGVTRTMTVAIAWRTGAILAGVSGKHEAGLERETRMPFTVALHTHARFELASPRLKNAKKLTPVLQDRAAKMSLKT